MSTKRLLSLLSILPLPITSLLGYLIGLLLWIIPNKRRRITYINLNYCLPELSSTQKHSIARKSLINECQTLLEIPYIMNLSAPQLLSRIHGIIGIEYLQEALKKDKGVILAALHLGNWEVIGLYCSQLFTMTSLYRPQHRSPELDAFIRQGRQRFGAHLVPTDISGVKALHKALENNHLTGILPDQNPGRGTGVFAPFFNHPANTMVLLPKLAQRNHSTVLYSYAERLRWGRGFRLHFIPVNDGIYSKDKLQSASVLNKGLEECIRKKPGQYWWSYKRFNVVPEGDKSPYL
ncbi:MAG: lysophospholipid acyltransferase family protein [Gammaproteobacteria bacterium]|nr:lysophospholipid acyltransferase family protein [Gammaproteobacteria bacterium]